MPKKPNTSSFNKLQTISGDIIDQAVTTYFKAPKSYTGEDMVELAVHGGNAVVKKIIGLLNKETH